MCYNTLMVISRLFDESNDDSTTLACFSPQVMALTFALEMILLMYVLVKHGLRSTSLRLIGFILFFLAMFQLIASEKTLGASRDQE